MFSHNFSFLFDACVWHRLKTNDLKKNTLSNIQKKKKASENFHRQRSRELFYRDKDSNFLTLQLITAAVWCRGGTDSVKLSYSCHQCQWVCVKAVETYGWFMGTVGYTSTLPCCICHYWINHPQSMWMLRLHPHLQDTKHKRESELLCVHVCEYSMCETQEEELVRKTGGKKWLQPKP